jgi:exopolyphosphatase/guanosine-5'-triphosphate,3'-diphosphate pyrophosphatase
VGWLRRALMQAAQEGLGRFIDWQQTKGVGEAGQPLLHHPSDVYNDVVSFWSLMSSHALAVIDIGSNTSRVTVFRMNGDGACEAVADSRVSLQLLRGLASQGRAEAEATASLLSALKDFKVVAEGAGADRTVALATYSMRGYPRAKELVRQIKKEIGIEAQIVDGRREAELGFFGAVYGLDVEDGMLIDLGGGSVELVEFRQRSLARSWSLPLGALLLNDRFLSDDPPSKPQIDALQEHVEGILRDAGIRPSKDQGRLIATGGTVRNLAKLDHLDRRYCIPQLHGYVLSRRRLKDLGRRLSGLERDELAEIPGLNADRKDSIVAGALALHAILRRFKADEVQVSGQGLREGFALSTRLSRLPPARSVRKTTIEALARRFATWEARAALRRAGLASALQAIVDGEAGEEIQECLLHAAWIVDIGKSIGYVGRFQHAVSVLLASDLAGFSHRQIALLAAVIGEADKRKFDWRVYRPLLSVGDEASVKRAGLILALADEVEKRLPPDQAVPVAYHNARRATIGLYLPTPFGGRLATLAARFTQVFGWELRFEEEG